MNHRNQGHEKLDTSRQLSQIEVSLVWNYLLQNWTSSKWGYTTKSRGTLQIKAMCFKSTSYSPKNQPNQEINTLTLKAMSCLYRIEFVMQWLEKPTFLSDKRKLCHRPWRWRRRDSIHCVLWHEWQGRCWRDSHQSRQWNQNSGERLSAERLLLTWRDVHWGESGSAGKSDESVQPLWAVHQVRVLPFSIVVGRIRLVGVTWRYEDDVLGRGLSWEQ